MADDISSNITLAELSLFARKCITIRGQNIHRMRYLEVNLASNHFRESWQRSRESKCYNSRKRLEINQQIVVLRCFEQLRGARAFANPRESWGLEILKAEFRVST